MISIPVENELRIRRADLRDVDALVAFNQAMARETEDKDLDSGSLRRGVERLLEQPQFGFYLVAESHNEIVGSAMITYEWTDWRDGVFWWIQSVYVPLPHRRKGIYRALYDQTKRLASADANVRGFRLYVEKENLVAQRTYEALGMTESYYKMYEEISQNRLR